MTIELQYEEYGTIKRETVKDEKEAQQTIKYDELYHPERNTRIASSTEEKKKDVGDYVAGSYFGDAFTYRIDTTLVDGYRNGISIEKIKELIELRTGIPAKHIEDDTLYYRYSQLSSGMLGFNGRDDKELKEYHVKNNTFDGEVNS